jgi:aminopeptidase-like protein
MSLSAFPDPDWDALTAQADDLLQRLFPICRSLTGGGVRQTLSILKEQVEFDLHEVPSGTVCYDWTVPDEWNVRDAFIADLQGRRLVDFQANNVHLVGYSVPVDREMSFDELAPHLHSLPDLPEAIPYRTSYYNRDWGFCLTHDQLQALDRRARYRVLIDSTLAPGGLTYGEAGLPGDSGQEYLVSTYVCHPSLANDNLSGVVLWTLLLRELSRAGRLRHAYRFVIVPETIGAVVYLARNETRARRFAGGFVVTTVGGPGSFGYKQTYAGDHLVDRAVRQTFQELELDYLAYPFDINGSDERQYSQPHFRIPVGTITRDKYYEYPYYHTSLDNLDFVRAENLVETLKLYLLAVEKLEQNRVYCSRMPYCEPMLGRRGLYPKVGGSIKQQAAAAGAEHGRRGYQVDAGRMLYGSELDAIRWLMFHADGNTSLLEIAERTGLPMRQLSAVAEKLVENDLLERV